jgi:hypothetical protein
MFRVEHACSTCPNVEKCHVNKQHLLPMHCSDTADCRTRCLPEFDAFEEANRSLAVGTRVSVGLDEHQLEELMLPLEP